MITVRLWNNSLVGVFASFLINSSWYSQTLYIFSQSNVYEVILIIPSSTFINAPNSISILTAFRK